jgi:hypothetical protein
MTRRKNITACETCPHRRQARIWCNQQAGSSEKSKAEARENGKKGVRLKGKKCEKCFDFVNCVLGKRDEWNQVCRDRRYERKTP